MRDGFRVCRSPLGTHIFVWIDGICMPEITELPSSTVSVALPKIKRIQRERLVALTLNEENFQKS